MFLFFFAFAFIYRLPKEPIVFKSLNDPTAIDSITFATKKQQKAGQK